MNEGKEARSLTIMTAIHNTKAGFEECLQISYNLKVDGRCKQGPRRTEETTAPEHRGSVSVNAYAYTPSLCLLAVQHSAPAIPSVNEPVRSRELYIWKTGYKVALSLTARY